MLSVATREQPVKWNTLFHDFLHRLGFTPTLTVMSSLDALTSYAAMSPDIYSDAVRGTRTAKTYGALLLALHETISSWPGELLERLKLPPVRIGDLEVPVSGPAMELFVVLYNAAVSGCNAGVAAMARMWDEQNCRTTRTSCLSSAPNADSKAAYKCFQAAGELAAAAEKALEGEADKMLLASDCYLVQHHFAFHGVRQFAELCAAVAKYVYSTTSGALSRKHDALAKLAHQAASVGLPAAFSSESLRLLPTLLLAAYHRHRAEHYDRAEKVPDMSFVLGHIAYARRLVEDMEQEWINAIESSSSSRDKKSKGSGWNLLGRLSAGLVGAQSSRENDDSEDSDAPKQPFKRLLGFLVDSDLVKVFPLSVNLIHDIAALYDKYQHENSVVYYTHPARERDVIADTPEVNPLSSSTVSAQSVSLASKLSVDTSKFSGLPNAEALWKAAQRKADHALREEVKRQLEAVQQHIHGMEEVLLLPISVLSELACLDPLLRRDGGVILTPGECINEASAAVDHAWQRHEVVSNELYRAKCEYIAEYVTPFKSTASLRERAQAWRGRAEAVRAALAKELPRHEGEAWRQTLLLPEEPLLRACMAQAEAAAKAAEKTLAWNGTSADDCAARVAELKDVRDAAAALLRRVTPLVTKSRWKRVTQALGEAAAVITDAEDFVEAAEAETQLMEAEKNRIAVTSLRRLNDVCLVDTALQRQQRGKGRKQQLENDESDESDTECPSTSATHRRVRTAESETRTAQKSTGDEEPKAPEAFVSQSLLQRIRQRERETEEMIRETSPQKKERLW